MEKDEDPWEILGVSRDASDAEIKKAFRKGALKYHPDRQQTEEDKAAAQSVFAKFSEAYETVSDPVKRYDWKLEEEKRLAKEALRSGKPSGPKAKKTAGPSKGNTPRTPQTSTAKKMPTTKKHQPHGPAPPSSSRPKTDQTKPAPAQSTPKGQQKQPVVPPAPTDKPNRSSAPATQPMASASSPTPSIQHDKRQSAPVTAAPKRMPKKHPPMNPTAAKGTKPKMKTFRDPFDIFDSLMKEEYGVNYKDRDDSGWKAPIGVPGLSMINPFKKKVESSRKEFKKLDVNNDKTLSKDELSKYIESRSDLWSSLARNLDVPEKKCVQLATDVAFSLAFGAGKKNVLHKNRELTEPEFKHFHKNYVLDEKGSHDFFLRIIFAIFDLNGDGVLNAKELNRFLDIFYNAKDIFKGDMRLPEKRHLLKIVGTRLDENRDGVLSFDEVRDLLEVAAVVSTNAAS